jgi:succinate dehydrogenase/fumarate reductase iron-sulfur protein
VLKDLIVSLDPFFDAWRAVQPALHAAAPDSRTLARVRPDSDFGREARAKRDCITCGACFAACGIKGTSDSYLGPAAINRALVRLLDPRDRLVDERLALLGREAEGVWRCHTQFNCVAACPKGIPLADSIARLKRSLLWPRRFREKLRSQDRAQV